jgi:hypothetical protein
VRIARLDQFRAPQGRIGCQKTVGFFWTIEQEVQKWLSVKTRFAKSSSISSGVSADQVKMEARFIDDLGADSLVPSS